MKEESKMASQVSQASQGSNVSELIAKYNGLSRPLEQAQSTRRAPLSSVGVGLERAVRAQTTRPTATPAPCAQNHATGLAQPTTPPMLSRAEQAHAMVEKLRADGVTELHFSYSNARGESYSITYDIDAAESCLERGFTFDGSSIEGFTDTTRSDLKLLPDFNACYPIPWTTDTAGKIKSV